MRTERRRTLGFGFIGAGAIAHFHARAVAAASGGRLVGVVSRRRGTAESFAKEHGIGFASDDVDELLAQPGLDAVCITRRRRCTSSPRSRRSAPANT